MVYIINNYDGSQLVGINDQTINSTATSLRLPGRDYKPYGEVIVENLVWMLQHFSGVTPPLRAVQGQIWYDSGLKVLKVYDSTMWLTIGKASTGTAFPDTGQDGQLFYHTTKKQLFVWDLTLWKLIAPIGAQDGSDPVSVSQIGHTQWEALTVSDDGATGHAILKASVGGTCVAIMSEDAQFTVALAPIAGFTPTIIKPGINLNTGMVLNGTATTADQATNSLNLGGVVATTYMRTDTSNVPSASGLSLGSSGTPYLNVYADNFVGNASAASTAGDSTLLDGQAASYYLDASNINSGTLDVARLPYTPVNKAGDTNLGNMTMSGTLTLNADPVAPLESVTKQYVDTIAATIPPLLTFTTGVVTATPFQNTTTGPDFNLNYFDLPPPVGKTVSNLVAFIPSIHAIYYSGDVNSDDSLHCQWQVVGANIRVWVFNTEQRSAPSAQYLAVWN